MTDQEQQGVTINLNEILSAMQLAQSEADK